MPDSRPPLLGCFCHPVLLRLYYLERVIERRVEIYLLVIKRILKQLKQFWLYVYYPFMSDIFYLNVVVSVRTQLPQCDEVMCLLSYQACWDPADEAVPERLSPQCS